jgi:pimeloyl-ACP methyl ester carboxylesterase
MQWDFESEQAQTETCANFARDGKLTREDPHDCFSLAPGRTSAEAAYLMDQFLKPYRYEATISEENSFHPLNGPDSEDSLEERRQARSFGNRPLIVLTAGLSDRGPEQSEADYKAFAAIWKKGHDRLAARSTRGESIVVPGAHHSIQLEQPQAVIDAIQRVVVEVRNAPTR